MKTCRLILVLAGLLLASGPARAQAVTSPDAPFDPETYVCYRATTPLQIDGRLDERAWAGAPWTNAFVDIEGNRRPAPRFRTRARMLWDDTYFYVAAELEEPDVWATLTRRDTVIFYDNDFEIFIDPDGDTHAYYEFEANAFGTVWDLMLLTPYREGGPAINGWDIAGLKVATSVQGTINRHGDRDTGWTIEIAMPWSALREAAAGSRAPVAGDQWRVNFSRVQWRTEVADGRYRKVIDPKTGRPFPEDNWVWSPQSVVNMHLPERWGYVQFSGVPSGGAPEPFVRDPNEQVKWALRRLYYAQRTYRDRNGRYATTLDELAAPGTHDDPAAPGTHDDPAAPGTLEELTRTQRVGAALGPPAFEPLMQTTASGYEITARGFDGKIYHIRHDGKVFSTEFPLPRSRGRAGWGSSPNSPASRRAGWGVT